MDDSSNLTEELIDVDNYIKEQNDLIRTGEHLKELQSSEAFQAVIVQGYVEAGTKELFDLLMTSNDVDRDQIMRRIDAIKYFKEYVESVETLAIAAPGNIKETQLVRDELVHNQNTIR